MTAPAMRSEWATEETAALLVEAVGHLALQYSLDVDVPKALQAARRAAGGSQSLDAGRLFDALESVARAAGLSLLVRSMTAREAVVTAATPMVIAAPTARGTVPLVVLQRSRGGVSAARRGLLAQKALIATLGGEQATVQVATVSPTAPLESLALPDEGHHSLWQRVAKLLALERHDLAVVLVYATGVGVLSVATPVAVQAVVNTVASVGLAQPLVVLSLLLFAALAGQATLRALQARVIELLERRLFVRAAIDFGHRLPRGAPASTLAHRFFEVTALQKTGSKLLSDGVAVVLQAMVGLLLMAFYHPYLLAFGLVLAVCVFGLTALPFRRGLSSAYAESSAKYAVADWLAELARLPAAFGGRDASQFAAAQTEAKVGQWLKARQAHFSVLFGQTLGAFALHVLASTALLGVGGALVMNAQLSLGQLVAAELVVTAVTYSLVKLGPLLDKAYDFTISVEKLARVVDVRPVAFAGGESLPSGGAGLTVRATEVPCSLGPLGLQLEVPASGRTLVVEPDGRARRQLAQWLAGRQRPKAGVIELQGVPTHQLDPNELQAAVALVDATGLFAGTVLDNVAVGRPEVGPAQVRAALEAVGLEAWLRGLPEGLQTVIAPSASELTCDEQAQLCVARALVGAPALVVVDDFFDGLSPVPKDACVRALLAPGSWSLVAVCSHAGSALARAVASAARLSENPS